MGTDFDPKNQLFDSIYVLTVEKRMALGGYVCYGFCGDSSF